MKQRFGFLATLTAGLLFLTLPALADEKSQGGHDHHSHGKAGHDHDKEGHSHGHAGHAHDHAAMGSHAALDTVRNHVAAMDRELAAGDLKGVHGHDGAIQAAVKVLGRDSSFKAGQAKRLQGYARNIAKLSGKMHGAADKKDLELARKEFAKLKAQVGLMEKYHPHAHAHQGGAPHSHGQEAGKNPAGK
jgi:hypothetical protein